MKSRKAQIKRVTKETRINLKLDLDGSGKSSIRTGVPFFDHMLTLFAKHATMDLTLKCDGDLEVDAHHTVEDCGIALGQALIREIRSRVKPTCPWTSAWRVVWWISVGDPTWSGADCRITPTAGSRK